MLITGTTALSTDTYIAALPEVQRSLGTSSSAAQLTMTACIAGMALGQLGTGPVSDSRGRRSLILLATLVFATTSVLCAGVQRLGTDRRPRAAGHRLRRGGRGGPGRGWAIVLQTTSVTALFGVAMLASQHQPPLAAVWACLCGMTVGLGTYLPANSSIAQAAGRRYAGTASALGGGVPFLVGACTTPLTGLIGTQSVQVMATAMVAFFTLAAITAVATNRYAPGASGPGDQATPARDRAWAGPTTRS